MDKETQDYISELIHLKKLGLLSDVESNNLESILKLQKMISNLEMEEPKITTTSLNSGKYEIKFVNTSENLDPTWEKDGDSGFDLRANSDGIIKPLDRVLIPTGLFFELPEGYDMEIKSRSGLALKHGIGVLTGTIDQNYRGELKVLLFNISNENFEFKKGDRIAQAIVRHRISTEFGNMVKLNSVDELSETNRKSNGFGSTGKN